MDNNRHKPSIGRLKEDPSDIEEKSVQDELDPYAGLAHPDEKLNSKPRQW